MVAAGERARSDYPAFAMLAVAALVAAIFIAGAGCWFETNDDVVMNAFAAGRFLASKPDAHLIFTNVIIGWALKRAYTAVPVVPWYGGYLLLTLAAAVCAFIAGLWPLARSWHGRALVLTSVLPIISATVTQLQFTRVGFFAVEAGWLLLAATLRAGSAQRRATLLLFLGGVLVWVGMLIRAEIAVIATGLSLPGIAAALMLRRSYKPPVRWRAATAAFAFVAAACAAAVVIDHASYMRDPTWRWFLEFQKRRPVFTDSNTIDSTHVPPAVLAHVGWSANDLSLLQHWAGVHSTIFSLEHQDYVIQHASRQRTLNDAESLRQLSALPSGFALWLYVAIAAAALVLDGDRSAFLTWAGSISMVAGAMTVLALTWHIPARFFEPALTAPAMWTLMVIARRPPPVRRPRWRSIAGWLVLSSAAAIAGIEVRADWRAGHDRSADYKQLSTAIERAHPGRDQLYVIWGGDFPYEHAIAPLDGFASVRNMRAVSLGWPNQSPHSLRRLAEFGIGDVYTGLWRRGNVLLIAEQDRCQRLTEFILTHYLQASQCETVDQAMAIRAIRPIVILGPSINVRWSPGLSPDARAAAEARYGLQRPRLIDARTWRYELPNTSKLFLHTLIMDARVEDTSGLDRNTGELIRPEADW